MKPMPEYVCTKKVRALKIERIAPREDGGGLELQFVGAPSVAMDKEWTRAHKALPGAYFLEDQQGGRSVMSAEAFERDHLLVPERAATPINGKVAMLPTGGPQTERIVEDGWTEYRKIHVGDDLPAGDPSVAHILGNVRNAFQAGAFVVLARLVRLISKEGATNAEMDTMLDALHGEYHRIGAEFMAGPPTTEEEETPCPPTTH